MAKVGFLGLGSMGRAMAGRLVDDGHTVHVWNRSPGAADELVARGAVLASSPAEALAQSMSLSMLADDRACEAVFDDVTLAAAAGPHINMASISPAAADRLHDRFAAAGVAYASAPVLGRPAAAAAGQLNILTAGDEGALSPAQELFDVLGVRTWAFGPQPRVANVVKVAVNYNLIHTIQALGESIALVESQGVDPARFHQLLTSSLFDGVAYRVYGTEIVDGAYRPPGFGMALGAKDLGLAATVAEESDLLLPTLASLHRVFERALQDDDLRGADWGAAAEVTRRRLLGGQSAGGDSSA
jgi:3-hydroxyisobutyrate dehydrogenase-like beta-hydroxyacid dehydrogenase